MVLYEDLRIYTIWRTSLTKQPPDSAEHQKSAEEWEILGELAERLHHFPEAVEAYQSCLRVRFSPKAMKGVLSLYERDGKYTEMLQALIRLIAWQYRWYSEVFPFQFLATKLSFCNPFPPSIKIHLINHACVFPPGYSSPPHSYVPFANSSSPKVPSRSEASCRQPACPSPCSTSPIATSSCAPLSAPAAATGERVFKSNTYLVLHRSFRCVHMLHIY